MLVFARDNPKLVANLQAVPPNAAIYGEVLRALARLGVLDWKDAPRSQINQAEAELRGLLGQICRACPQVESIPEGSPEHCALCLERYIARSGTEGKRQ